MKRTLSRFLAICLSALLLIQSSVLFPLTALAGGTQGMTMPQEHIPFSVSALDSTVQKALPTLPINLRTESQKGDVGDNNQLLASTRVSNYGNNPTFVIGDNNRVEIMPEVQASQGSENKVATEVREPEEDEIVNYGDNPMFIIGDDNTVTTVPNEDTARSQGRKIESIATGLAKSSSDCLDGSLSSGYVCVTSYTQLALQTALTQAVGNSGIDTIVDLRPIAGSTISLNSSLNTIGDFNHAVWVISDSSHPVVIDGNNSYQILSINNSNDSGFLAFYGVEFKNGLAKGGDATGGGGGGLGAGGALFINDGTVVVEQSKFTGNAAQAGISSGTGGEGGDSNKHGSNGSSGGSFNVTSAFSIGSPGSSGSGGSTCGNSNSTSCSGEDSKGGDGNWGNGGGSGGGGGGDRVTGAGDAGRDGGEGGHGGFGGGGGGGGGGGEDDEANVGDTDGTGGKRGLGGLGGDNGLNGKSGSMGSNANGNGGGTGGSGGDGAGLGGAIFVRNGDLTVSNSTFSTNSAKGSISCLSSSNGVSNPEDYFDFCDDDSAYYSYDQETNVTIVYSNSREEKFPQNSSEPDFIQPSDCSPFVPSPSCSETSVTIDFYPFSDSPNFELSGAKGSAISTESEFQDNGTTDFHNDNIPTLTLSLVDLDDHSIASGKIHEGERANLKISSEYEIDKGTEIYFYLSDSNSTATHSNSLDINFVGEDKDFVWSDKLPYSVTTNRDTNQILISLPAEQNVTTTETGVYSGIQTYIDKSLEGDENFTVTLLPGPGYKLGNSEDIEQEVIIEDINYQAEILNDQRQLEIYDVADGLEPRDGGPQKNEIDVAQLKGLGYATIQVKRPTVALSDYPNWDSNSNYYDTTVNGDFFNNALAGGLPIHYTITPSNEGDNSYLSNQVNYNNSKYDSVAGQVDNFSTGAQVFNAVVIPATDPDAEPSAGDIPPGSARIYFATLPDAVQENPESYTLTLQNFPNDPSYDPNNFCPDQTGCDSSLQNTPAGEYQFYSVKSSNTVMFTINDGDDFIPDIAIADNINGELVSDDVNALVPNAEGSVTFWAKLTSQPNGDTTVKLTSSDASMSFEPSSFSFNQDNWYVYQQFTVTGASTGQSIEINATSSDDSNYSGVNRTLSLVDSYDHLKITEGNQPDLSQRNVTLAVTPSMDKFVEGGLDTPGFIVTLGQPLPQDIVVNYDLTINNQSSDTVTIPAYRRSVNIPVPIADDDLVNGERIAQINLTGITDANGTTLTGVAIVGGEAEFTIKDNDKATVLISQHQPEAPTDGDVAIIVPEVEIVGINPDTGELQVQSTDPLIKNIVIAPQEALRDGEPVTATQGLLKEMNGSNNTGGTAENDDDFPYLSFPSNPRDATIQDHETPFSIDSLESKTIVRLSGTLTPKATGSHTFFLTAPDGSLAEFWLSQDGYSQNKTMLVPTWDDQDSGDKDSSPDLYYESESYELEAGQEYYVEALYRNTTDSPVGSFNVTWQPDAAPVDIPLDVLKPAKLNYGFAVETWTNLESVESIDDLVEVEAFQNNQPNETKVLTRNLNIPKDNLANIGRRIRTVVTAPESGEYTFALASDGDSQLRLKGDKFAEQLIAEIDGEESYGFGASDKVGTSDHPVLELKGHVSKPKDNQFWDFGVKGITKDSESFIPATYDGTQGAAAAQSLFVRSENWEDDNKMVGIIFKINDDYSHFDELAKLEGWEITDEDITAYFIKTYQFEEFPDPEQSVFSLDGHLVAGDEESPPTSFPGYQEWNWDRDKTPEQRASQQQSEPIYLEAGQQYILEVLQVNKRDYDHLSVAWQLPSADSLALIPAKYTSLPDVNIPLRILTPDDADAVAKIDAADGAVATSLRLSSNPIKLFGADYQVKSVTLAGDPGSIAPGVAAHKAPSFLQFASGFRGTLLDEVTLESDSNTDVSLMPQDLSSDPASVNLTEGQQQRLGFQLKGQPDKGVTVTVNLDVQGEAKGQGATIKLLCAAGEDQACKTLEFKDTNWNQPQYVTVEALSAGYDGQGEYEPDSSHVELVANPSTALKDGGGFAADSVTVNVFPDSLESSRVYLVKPNGNDILNISYGDPSGIQVIGENDFVSGWTWELEDNGNLVAKVDDTPILTLTPYSEIASLPIYSFSDPVSMTASATVEGDFFNLVDPATRKGEITITGITLDLFGSALIPSATVTIILNNGKPTLDIRNQLSGDVTLTDPQSFSYTIADDEKITADVGDVLLTEYGEFRVTTDGSQGQWSYEPNPRQQPQDIFFSVFNASESQTIFLQDELHPTYPQIITSLAALPDTSKPLAEISANPSVSEDAGDLTVTIELDNPHGDTQVYYTVDTPGSSDPGNIALDLTALDDTSLELMDEGISLNSSGMTAELWVKPTALTGEQGLLLGSKSDGSEQEILSLSGSKLKAGSLTANLSSDLVNQWFHVAYVADDSKSVLYVNGKEVATEDAPSSLPITLKAIARGVVDNSKYFNGLIDDVRLWNEARSDVKIQNNYASGLATNDDDVEGKLTGYWTFNQLDLSNKMDDSTTTELELIDSARKSIAPLWSVRQSATVGEDYDAISGIAPQQLNVFGLDAEEIGDRSTFAIADFDRNGQPDAAIMDGKGDLWLFRNQGDRNKKNRSQDGTTPGFNLQAQRVGINLGEAVPFAAGDIDRDGDLDLVIGTADGGVSLIENTGQQRSTSSLFKPLQPLTTRSRSPLNLGSAVSPTIADLNGDGVPEVITINQAGQVEYFSVSGRRNGRPLLQRGRNKLLPKLPEADQGYFIQFIDLDKDGDLDALVDYRRNKPGQKPGGYRYFANYGNAYRPFFVEAPRSRVASHLHNLDREVTYGTRTLRHPYDQVEFYTFADWDGDGDLDLFQSDNQGLIHLRENRGFDSVTIPAGQTSATLSINLTDDNQAEPTEFIQLRLIEGNVATADYHTEVGSDRVVIEITDNDEPGITILDSSGIAVDTASGIKVSETSTTPVQYQVKLASKPNSDVYLKIASSDPQQGLVGKTSGGTFKDAITVPFTPDMWDSPDSPQNFYLQGVDDQIDDEDQTFSYVVLAQSADANYRNSFEILSAVSTDNNETAGLNLTFDSLPEAAVTSGAVQFTEGQINTVKVALNSQPTQPVTLTLKPEDSQLTFYPQRRVLKMVDINAATRQTTVTTALRDGDGDCKIEDTGDGTSQSGQYGTLCWREDGAYIYQQNTQAEIAGQADNFTYVIDNGYGSLSTDTTSIRVPDPMEEGAKAAPNIVRTGNLLFNGGLLAGQSMALTFTPQDWNLERTVAVAAVEDDLVEYNRDSHIQILLADATQPIYGNYGILNWNADGTYTYSLQPELNLDPGTYQEHSFYFTRSDDTSQNHTLDLLITAEYSEDIQNPDPIYNVSGLIDQNLYQVLSVSSNLFDGRIPLPEGINVTNMSLDLLDPVYLAAQPEPIRVNIEDNDKPIVRAGVDLNAGENTHPGYFTLSVMEPVGYPGGLPVHYKIYGAEDAAPAPATAELQPPVEGTLADPGPDFQITDELKEGILYIPEGKTRVSFPIFPIDDFTPEESLAARYEKVIAEIQTPGENDQYVLDQTYPDTQIAAVRILDNEEVGLKIVIPADGLAIDEGEFNGFRVGLKSQPQTGVQLKFYYDDIQYGNERDRTFLDASTVDFNTNNWNQWQTVDVHLFNNLENNDDDLYPRYTDLYFTLLDQQNPLCNGDCEPFYNTVKGALNFKEPADSTANEPDVLEGTATLIGEDDFHTVEGAYGTVTLTDVVGEYLGDFEYLLDSAKQQDTLNCISDSGIGTVLDVFDYQIDSSPQQQLAVEIKALNSTTVNQSNVGQEVQGDFGTLTLNSDGQYTYTLTNPPIDENGTIHDSFVYTLQTPDANAEGQNIENYYAFNIDITKHGDTLSALVNGDNPDACEDGSGTVCDNTVSGTVIASDIGGDAPEVNRADIPKSTVIAVGRTVQVPIVTNMYLRNADGRDLRVKNKRILANPLFTANHINRIDESVAITDTATITGKHGDLTVNSDGSYIYKLTEDLSVGLDPVDERIVSDRFYHLSKKVSNEVINEADDYLQLVIVYENETGQTIVQANGTTLTPEDGSCFTGRLFSEDIGQESSTLTVERIGLASSSIYLQEQPLDPFVVTEGLKTALNFLQARFYDVSVPVMGRMGGGSTADASGSSDGAKVPSFADRLVSIIESEITKNPHVTATDLETIFKKALQSVFGEYGVPLQVLKLDTEKLLLKLSFGYGASTQTDEYETDWGLPGMGHFAGQAKGTAKLTFDLVFGIKFRTYQQDGTGAKWQPGVFIVTDQTALDSLLGSPDTTTSTTLYQLRTWEGASVFQNGILFTKVEGGTLAPPANFEALNIALEKYWNQEHTSVILQQHKPQIIWGWKNIPPKYSSNPSGTRDKSTIVGTVYDSTEVLGTEADFIEISLTQPTAIGPNKVADVQINVTVDPEHYLRSTSDEKKGERLYVEAALDALLTSNTPIQFSDRIIKAIDINGRESQELQASFTVHVDEANDSQANTQSYTASITLDSDATTIPVIPDDSMIIPVLSTYLDHQSVTTTCKKTQNNPCQPGQLTVKDLTNNSKSYKFPNSADVKTAFKSKKTFSDTIQLEDGDLKIIGKLKGQNVEWNWQFSANSGKSSSGWSNGTKDIEIKVKGSEEKTSKYTLSKYPVMFLSPDRNDEQKDPKFEAVSKLTAELSSSLDFRGDAQLYVMGASINQAVMQPSNPPPTSKEDVQHEPAKVYSELVGKLSVREKVVDITDKNPTQENPAYIVGQYGTLALAQDGSYSYYLKEDLLKDSYSLSCANLTGENAAAQESLCDELLKTDENDRPVYWNDPASSQSGIEFKGYSIDCPEYNAVVSGQACTVQSPQIIMTDTSAENLELQGVPTLETVVDVDGLGIPGWENVSSLSNRISMHDFYYRLKRSGNTYGITAIHDEFFITTDQVSFRKLKLTLDSNEVTACWDANENLISGSDLEGWKGSLPIGVEPLQASPGNIQPMAKVKAYLDIALKDSSRSTESTDGLLYLGDLAGKGITQFTLGGDASLFAEINAGVGDAPTEDDDVDDGFELPLPSVTTKLGLIAHYAGTTDVPNVASRGGKFVFGVYDLGLDLGSFLSEQLVGPLSHLSDELEPIKPIANALTADMKIFSKINLESVFDSNSDGRVTVLEIPTPFLGASNNPKSQRYANMLKKINKSLEFITGILQMINIAAELGDELSGVTALSEQVISLDGYLVSPQDIRITPLRDTSDLPGVDVSLVPYVNHLGHIILGSDKGFQYSKTLTGNVNPGTVKEVESKKPEPPRTNRTTNKSMGKVKSRYNDLRDKGIISFPILSNPLDVIKLIFGDPADLIVIDVPDMDFDFEIDKKWRVPEVPIFYGKIAGNLQIGTDIDLGVDTGGLLAAACGTDTPGRLWDCQRELSAGDSALRLLNSIYLRDWSEQSYTSGGDGYTGKTLWKGTQREVPNKTVWDKFELFGNAEVDIGAGLDIFVVGTSIQGGPGLGGGVDLVDICETTTPDPCDPIQNGSFTAGGDYDGKLRAYDFVSQIINDAGSAFDVGFTFYVDFEAEITSLEIVVWHETIGYFPLFQFDLDGVHWVGGGTSEKGYPIVGSTIFFDANGNGIPDAGEPIGFTDSNGRSTLNIPYLFFDKNDDGVIDERDGQIVLLNGFDTETGKTLKSPLVSSPQMTVISH